MPSCKGKFFLFLAIMLSVVLSACTFFEKKDLSPQRRYSIKLFSPKKSNAISVVSEREARDLAKKMFLQLNDSQISQNFVFSLDQSLAYLQTKEASSTAFTYSGLTITYGELFETLTFLKTQKDILSPELLATQFTWYRVGPDFDITGYFEPTLYASKVKTPEYYYPLYKLPHDTKGKTLYFTRHEIDRQGALTGKGLEIAWVDNEVDAFFLHVQGSGRLIYSDGSTSHILYAGKNNQPYKSIGRLLREKKLMNPNNINMESIKEFLTASSSREKILDSNPSYVFFREAKKGPIGSMGKPLTPYVSIATDPSLLPFGILSFIVVPLPDAKGELTKPFYGLTLPQDTGGAIKKNRIDLFCGPGKEASHIAGYLDTQGAVYILLKKITK